MALPCVYKFFMLRPTLIRDKHMTPTDRYNYLSESRFQEGFIQGQSPNVVILATLVLAFSFLMFKGKRILKYAQTKH